MVKDLLTPDYIFESGWEVCNKVGGAYTILSAWVNTLQKKLRDRIFFIGPDVWQGEENPLLIGSDNLCAAWKKHTLESGHPSVCIGRWNIPGELIVILVDFQPFFKKKNDIYTEMWDRFQVDLLHAYGDYDEASMFSYVIGRIIESFYRYNPTEMDKAVYQAHEWMTGMGALYAQGAIPEVITIFTTRATSIGRSIAGNHKPLYDYLFTHDGDQMAQELNMQSKHSIEKQTAHHVDCFTTVGEITNNECKELLDKPADVVLMNGFEDDFAPKGNTFTGKYKRTRSLMLDVANKLLGTSLDNDMLIIGASGRYEFKNKGIDVFLESLNRLNRDKNLHKNVLAFINVPDQVGDPRENLQVRLKSKEKFDTPLEVPFVTHWLHSMTHDQILGMLKYLGMGSRPEDRVRVILVPCHLDDRDGIMNKEYYDILLGQDLSVYASYYEPRRYTPLESIAFRIPIIITDPAGSGLWVNSLKNQCGINGGAKVLRRSDYNDSEMTDGIKDTVTLLADESEKEVKEIRKRAADVAEQALWKHFIQYYYEAYDIVLRNALKRQLS